MSKKDEYIGEICEKIKCKDIEENIREELDIHILDLTDEFLKNGSNAEEAEIGAISCMGDSSQISDGFNKIYKYRYDLKTIGLLIVFFILSLSTNLSFFNLHLESTATVNIIMSLFAFIGGVFLVFTNYKRIEKISFFMFFINFLLTIVFAKLNLSIDLGLLCSAIYIISFPSILRKYKNLKIVYTLGIIAVLLMTLLSVSYSLIIGISFTILCIKNSNFKELNKKLKLIGLIPIAILLILCGIKIFSLNGLPYIQNYYAESISKIENVKSIFQQSEFLGHSKKLFENHKYNEELQLYTGYVIQDTEGNEYAFKIQSTYVFLYLTVVFGWGISLICFFALMLLICCLYKIYKSIKESYGKMILLSLSSFVIMLSVLGILCNIGLIPYIAIDVPFISLNIMENALCILIVFIILSINRRKDFINCLSN